MFKYSKVEIYKVLFGIQIFYILNQFKKQEIHVFQIFHSQIFLLTFFNLGQKQAKTFNFCFLLFNINLVQKTRINISQNVIKFFFFYKKIVLFF